MEYSPERRQANVPKKGIISSEQVPFLENITENPHTMKGIARQANNVPLIKLPYLLFRIACTNPFINLPPKYYYIYDE